LKDKVDSILKKYQKKLNKGSLRKSKGGKIDDQISSILKKSYC